MLATITAVAVDCSSTPVLGLTPITCFPLAIHPIMGDRLTFEVCSIARFRDLVYSKMLCCWQTCINKGNSQMEQLRQHLADQQCLFWCWIICLSCDLPACYSFHLWIKNKGNICPENLFLVSWGGICHPEHTVKTAGASQRFSKFWMPPFSAYLTSFSIKKNHLPGSSKTVHRLKIYWC